MVRFLAYSWLDRSFPFFPGGGEGGGEGGIEDFANCVCGVGKKKRSVGSLRPMSAKQNSTIT